MQNFNLDQCVIKYGYENMDFIKVTKMLSKAFWSPGIKIDEVLPINFHFVLFINNLLLLS